MPNLEGYDVREIGLAWYSPSTWRELCTHPEARIEKSYSEFVRTYERMSAGYAREGFQIVKLPIDIALLIQWCHKHGYEIDGKGRAAFGAALQAALAAGKDVMALEWRDDTRSVQ
jgi:hypothetical protein